MVIEKGKQWGRIVSRPAQLRTVGSDHALATALGDGTGLPTAPTGGDLHKTVGGRSIDSLDELLELPIDLLSLSLDGAEPLVACAHVVLRPASWRGGFWRGEFVMVMNAEFIGEWQVAARGHPNDGRAETCEWGADFGLRQRFEARRRLRTGTHVPHPRITMRSSRNHVWTFVAPMTVIVDGLAAGRAREITLSVRPDAAVIYA